MLKNELSTAQERNKKQTEELKPTSGWKSFRLRVEQASLQEKCRLTVEEVRLV